MIAIEGAEGHATRAYQARPLVDALLDGGLARLIPSRRVDVHLNQLQHLATLPVLLCDSLRPVDLTDASQLRDSHRAYGSHRSSQRSGSAADRTAGLPLPPVVIRRCTAVCSPSLTCHEARSGATCAH